MTVKLGVNFISQKYKVCISITIWNHSEVYVDIFKYAYVSLKLIVFCLFFFFLRVLVSWQYQLAGKEVFMYKPVATHYI